MDAKAGMGYSVQGTILGLLTCGRYCYAITTPYKPTVALRFDDVNCGDSTRLFEIGSSVMKTDRTLLWMKVADQSEDE